MAKRKRPPESRTVYHWQRRSSSLLVLNDQGASVKLNPEAFGVMGRDRSWNSFAQNFLSANEPQLQALEARAALVPDADQIHLCVKPGGTVGAVPLRSATTRKVIGGLVVRPRFGWNDIGPLLQEIGWTASPQLLEFPLVPGAAREVPPWVLAGPILECFRTLIRELTRGFRLHEEVRQSPRGQIVWQRYVTEQVSRGAYHQLPCRFPELGPDMQLRAMLRWGLEVVHRSLSAWAAVDSIARHLAEQAMELLLLLADVKPLMPGKSHMSHLLRTTGLPPAALQRGLQALGWLVDERGLAGTAETDGLAWCLPMYELFERWVEHLVRLWAHGFGGHVRSGRTFETLIPIRWQRSTVQSLHSLVPDLVVQQGRSVWIIDAKYKGHFEELDDVRWKELAEELQAEHRHDLHQVLAYAATSDADQITSVLVYPMLLPTWQRLVERNRTLTVATIAVGGRVLRLVLMGIPIQMPSPDSVRQLIASWDALTLWDAA